VSAIAVAIALASVSLCGAAAKALGKQWTSRARMIEDHELITEGRIRWYETRSTWECSECS
jgi:isoprenylcysteine carboxyl methyltransferase (ICMT) family protein YpbQ